MLTCSVCAAPILNPGPYQTECDIHDGTIPCPSAACQCEWCQMPCSVCGTICGHDEDSHRVGDDWLCYPCWRDYDDDLTDDPTDICPPIPRG